MKKKHLKIFFVIFIVIYYHFLFVWIPIEFSINKSTLLYEVVSNLYLLSLLYIPIYYNVIEFRKYSFLSMWGLAAILLLIQCYFTNYGSNTLYNPDLWLNIYFSFCYLKNSNNKKQIFKWLTLSFFTCLVLIVVFALLSKTSIFLFLGLFISGILWFLIAAREKLEDYYYSKSEEKIEIARLEELTKYNEEKLIMMKNIQNDIQATDHRLFYILYQLELCLDNDEYDKAKIVLQKYKDLVTKYKIVINTGNSIFDMLYSLKMNDFIMREIKVENNLFISQNEFYNDFEFINFLCDLLNYFSGCKYLYITMQEDNNRLVVKIMYREGEVDISKIEEHIKFHLHDKDLYNLDQYNLKGIRLLLDLRG